MKSNKRCARGWSPPAFGRSCRVAGWLVIVDETYPETAAELRAPLAQFAVQTAFEELHWGNIIPTQSEQTALLAAAGFGAPVREVMAAGFTILKAQRPAV